MTSRAFSEDQFEFLSLERQGGMSKIKKAILKESNQLCALKYAKWSSEDDAAAASFNRELEALENLSHKHVVRLIGVGSDGTQRFLVLEWLEETLLDRVQRIGAIDWPLFYEMIGRPLLEGIQYAHSRRRTHRDLKPLNVMFDASNVAKITDFGIAKDLDDIRPGMSFNRIGTPPWTPPEVDDHIHSESRDLYSWAAICVSCLTGRIDFRTVQDIRSAVVSLGGSAPSKPLLACLSDDLAVRPGLAQALLWDLDDFHKSLLDRTNFERQLGVEISPHAAGKLEQLIPDAIQIEPRIDKVFADFALPCEVSSTADGSIEFSGQRFELTAARASIDSPWLVLKDIRPASARPGSIPAFQARIRFVERAHATDIGSLRSNLAFIENFLKEYISREQEAQKRLDEDRYLIMLQDILTSRMRSLRHLPSVDYTDGKWEGGEFAVVINSDEVLVVGEQRIIRYAGGILVFEISRFSRGRTYLRPIGIRKGNPSADGTLQVDTLAQRRALERQEDAIKTIRGDMAVLPSLRTLILNPASAELPEKGERPTIEGLSPDKDVVVKAALGLRQMMVVQGPPGTGKTKLITEVVRRFLYEHPHARVLVAAQTHTAVDHVLEKLLEAGEKGGRIVRIARADEDKVSTNVQGALLQNCLAAWCELTAERSRLAMSARGRSLGFDVGEVELSVRVEALVLATTRLQQVKNELVHGESNLAEAETEVLNNEDEIADVESATVATLSVADLESELTRLTENVLRLREELSSLGNEAASLALLPDNELREWNPLLKRSEPAWLAFRKELELQVAWLDLLGQMKQFEEVVLRSASVVAGTCIGLGSSEAFTKTRFDLCIIDEASKATASETLVPMIRSERFLVVGDPRQLAPFQRETLDVEGYADGELKETLLDYLLPRLPSACVYELTHQHRMCQSIGELISTAFYGGKLVNKRSDNDRPGWLKKKYPKPVLWIDTQGWTQGRMGHSFVNKKEQDIVLELLSQLQHGAGRAKSLTSVAVIAGYAAQANTLDSRIQRGSLASLSIEVATVDSFQGREADVCIFSVTLSNSRDFLGFLRSVERLNVALSRPRDLLVIVGSQDFCYAIPGQNPFIKVIDFIEAHPSTCETLDASK
jgi:serine/threonine protein kinase